NTGSALSLNNIGEFNNMAVRFASFIETADSSKILNISDIFNTFYWVNSGKISYMTIPRRDEIKVFKNFMEKEGADSSVYEFDILSFFLDHTLFEVRNVPPELCESVSFKPLFFESIGSDPSVITSQMPLSGALSDYKLYFQSAR